MIRSRAFLKKCAGAMVMFCFVVLPSGGISLSQEPAGAELLPSPQNRRAIQLALKFVELLHQDGSLMLYEKGAKILTSRVNKIFKACQIEFKMEDYRAVNPKEVGLDNYPQSLSQMNVFRKPFDDPRYLVIVKTGKWDHEKVGTANAWTAMPGDIPAGVVIESPVASFAGIVAHELGHYLDLYHVENSKNLMNAMIYGDSIQLSSKQCTTMRSTAMKVWVSALRSGRKFASLDRKKVNQVRILD